MKISILGCGWLGLPLGQKLVQRGFIVKGSTTSEEKLSKIRAADIQPFLLKVTDQLEGKNAAAFFHSDLLILNIPPGRRNPNVVEEHPLQIRAVAEAAQKGGITHLIFVSSTGVFGNTNTVITEADAPCPERNSGKALVKAERLLKEDFDFKLTILRMAGLVGGERKAGRFLAGKKNVKNGNAPVNMVHRDDCIAIIEQIILQEKWNEIFHVCADKHPSKKEFYTSQAEKQGFEAPTFAEEKEISYKIVDNEKVKMSLNYTFLWSNPMTF